MKKHEKNKKSSRFKYINETIKQSKLPPYKLCILFEVTDDGYRK